MDIRTAHSGERPAVLLILTKLEGIIRGGMHAAQRAATNIRAADFI